jgi:hypothetical protein
MTVMINQHPEGDDDHSNERWIKADELLIMADGL